MIRCKIARGASFFFTAVTIVALAAELASADMIVSASSRTVTALGTYAIGATDTSVAQGTYIHSVTAPGVGPAGSITTNADQSSFIPSTIGPVMSGTGSGDATVSATGADGFSVTALSTLSANFTVPASVLGALSASVKWTGSVPPYSGFTTVELKDLTNVVSLASVTRNSGAPGTSLLGVFVPLAPGVSYRLEATANIGGGFGTAGFYTSDAEWSFSLIVPEPSSMALGLAAGIPLMAAAVRSRARRRTSRG